MSLVAFHMRAAVLYAVAAMLLGVAMAASGDHAQAATHAHLNLVGWVSIALTALVLRAWPELAWSRLAKVQAVLAHLGVVTLIPGIALVHAGFPVGEAVAGVGSLLTLGGMVTFAAMVFMVISRRTEAAQQRT